MNERKQERRKERVEATRRGIKLSIRSVELEFYFGVKIEGRRLNVISTEKNVNYEERIRQRLQG